MDQFPREELKTLLTPTGGHCVSLYLPAHGNPFEAREDPIRFRNLLKEAEERLIQEGLRAVEAKEFLAPMQRLLDEPSVWQYQPNGLVVFLSRDFFRVFRLPVDLEELVAVAPRFHLKPLIHLLTEDYGFYLLALSQKEIRLLQGNRFRVWDVEIDDKVPKSLDEAIKYDDPERQFQFKGKATVGRGQRHALVFSHGAGLENSKDDIQRYLLQVDRGLQDVLRPERSPLLLAGVDYLLPIYREVNTYPHLLEEAIIGNPQLLGADELHARAWQKVHAHFLKDREEAIAQYRQLAGGGRTSKELEEILPAAAQGRVYKLLVATGMQVWGNFLPDAGTVQRQAEPTAGSEDLLDLAAIQTLLNGGVVYTVERSAIPDDSPIAAVFRY